MGVAGGTEPPIAGPAMGPPQPAWPTAPARKPSRLVAETPSTTASRSRPSAALGSCRGRSRPRRQPRLACGAASGSARAWAHQAGLVGFDARVQRPADRRPSPADLVQPAPGGPVLPKPIWRLSSIAEIPPLLDVTRKIARNHLAKPVLVCSKIVPASRNAVCRRRRTRRSGALCRSRPARARRPRSEPVRPARPGTGTPGTARPYQTAP